MKSTIKDIKVIDIPKIIDHRGNISFVEKELIPYKIRRVYFLYDVPSGVTRGGHAHKELYQLLIALSGSFDVHLSDGKSRTTVSLNRPNKGLLIVPGIWREIDNFSSGSVCLVIASDVFKEEDYIRDYNDFLKSKS